MSGVKIVQVVDTPTCQVKSGNSAACQNMTFSSQNHGAMGFGNCF